MDFLRKTCEVADGIIEMAGWMFKRLESPGRVYAIESARGASALVSVGIKPGATGEVILEQNGVRQHYPARGNADNGEFKRGSRVRIIDVAANIVYVETLAGADGENEESSHDILS